MPYSITLTNGNVYAAVADGTINTDSNMILIGKDFAGYGQFIDQNIIRLLESSASPYRPVNKVLEGQLWYDQTNSALKVAYRAGIGNTAGWTTASPSRFLGNPGSLDYANTPPSNAAPGDLWYCLGYAGNIGNILRDDLAVIRMNAGVSSTDLDISWPVVGPHNQYTVSNVGNINADGVRARYLDVTFFANISNANIFDFRSAGRADLTNASIANGGVLEIAGLLDLNANRGTSNAWIPNLIGSTLRVDGVNQNEEGNVTSFKFLARPPYGNGGSMGAIATNWNTTGNVPGDGNGAGFFGNVFGNYVYGSEIGNALVSDFNLYIPGVANSQAITGGATGSNNQRTVFHGYFANDAWSWRQPFIQSIGANANVANSTNGYPMNTAIWSTSVSSGIRTANIQWDGWQWGNQTANGNGNIEAFSFLTDVIGGNGQITGTVRANTLSNVGYYGPNTWVVANAFVGNLYGAIKGAITKPIEANTTTVFAGNLAANTITFPVGGKVIQNPSDLPADLTPFVPSGSNISIYAPRYPGSGNNYSFFDVIYANSMVIWDGHLEVGGRRNDPTANGNAMSTFYGDVTISGNLNILGTTIQRSNTEVVVNSTTFQLADNATLPIDLNGGGIKLGAQGNVLGLDPPSMLYEYGMGGAVDRWVFNKTIRAEGVEVASGDVVLSPAGSFQGQLGTPSIRNDAYLANLYLYGNVIQDTPGASPAFVNIYAKVSQNMRVIDLFQPCPASPDGVDGNAVAAVADSGNTTLLNNTIVCRDSVGVMYGIAAQALYADLAEKYLLDAEYPKGTMVAVGGTAEATACTTDLTPFGIISTNPAFKMNGGLEGGEFIALKGRVPTRVVGEIRRGQKLGPSSIPGVATANESNWIAIALDNYNSDDEGIIEAIVM